MLIMGTKLLSDDRYKNDEKLWSISQNNHNPNWLYISDHPYIILIIDSSGSGNNNVLLYLNKISTTRCW